MRFKSKKGETMFYDETSKSMVVFKDGIAEVTDLKTCKYLIANGYKNLDATQTTSYQSVKPQIKK